MWLLNRRVVEEEIISDMFNGPKFTVDVKDLLFAGKFDEAEALVYTDDSEFPTGEMIRINRLRKLCNSVKRISEKKLKDPEERVILSPYDEHSIYIESIPDDLLNMDYGFYRTGKKVLRPSSFDRDFFENSESDRKNLVISRFNTSVEAGTESSFRITKNTFLCGDDHMMHAYASEDNKYIRDESGKLAKSCRINTRYPSREAIPAALMLPIPHHSKNYYHILGEMMYGLRLVKYINKDTPIIYQDDNFGILESICEILGIGERKLISFKEAKYLLIEKSIIPSYPPYYWNDDVFRFFKSMVTPHPEPILKIYVSRRFSGRGPSNEEDVENYMRSKGFIIIYSETLSFKQQIRLFSMANVVVSAHGAGLTNIGFMDRGTTLIELLPKGMLMRDFYMRSRNNNMKYSGIIFEDVLDIRDLDNRVIQHGAHL